MYTLRHWFIFLRLLRSVSKYLPRVNLHRICTWFLSEVDRFRFIQREREREREREKNKKRDQKEIKRSNSFLSSTRLRNTICNDASAKTQLHFFKRTAQFKKLYNQRSLSRLTMFRYLYIILIRRNNFAFIFFSFSSC